MRYHWKGLDFLHILNTVHSVTGVHSGRRPLNLNSAQCYRVCTAAVGRKIRGGLMDGRNSTNEVSFERSRLFAHF